MRTFQTISFHINYFTKYGQSLFLAGNLWNNWQDFVPMRWTDGGRWEVACDAPLSPSKSSSSSSFLSSSTSPSSVIEYKYIVCDQTRGDVTWESSGNRKLVVASDEKEEGDGVEKGKLTLVVNDVWDFPSQTSFAWKQSEAENDPSTYFTASQQQADSGCEKKKYNDPNNNNNNNNNNIITKNNNINNNNNNNYNNGNNVNKNDHFGYEDNNNNKTNNYAVVVDDDEEDEEEEEDNNNNNKKIVYEWCVVDEERIRKINAQKRKKMIAARKAKTVRRPPTVHTPSPLTQSTIY